MFYNKKKPSKRQRAQTEKNAENCIDKSLSQTCAMAKNQGPRSSRSRVKYTFQDPGFPRSRVKYTFQDPGFPRSHVKYTFQDPGFPGSHVQFQKHVQFPVPETLDFRIQGFQGPMSGTQFRILGSQGPMTSINFRIQSPQCPTS